MIAELTDAQLTALVADNLRKHAARHATLRSTGDQPSDCRRRIIDLLGLSRPKSIVHVVPDEA